MAKYLALKTPLTNDIYPYFRVIRDRFSYAIHDPKPNNNKTIS